MESGTCCSRPILTLHIGSGSVVVCLCRCSGFCDLFQLFAVRPKNSPFTLSRHANLTHAVAARLSLSIPSWQHVYHRVLRELDIEFEPTRHWTSSFFTVSSHFGSRRSCFRGFVSLHFVFCQWQDRVSQYFSFQ